MTPPVLGHCGTNIWRHLVVWTPGQQTGGTRWNLFVLWTPRQQVKLWRLFSPQRFQEQREFGSCCYGFALSFINHVMRSEGNKPISREHFTSQYVLPKMEMASRFLLVYQHICQRGYYSTSQSHGPWTTHQLVLSGNGEFSQVPWTTHWVGLFPENSHISWVPWTTHQDA